MACCILGAIIISQILAVWRARRRVLLYVAGLLVSTSAFAWQIDAHWDHVKQFVLDAQAVARGEDLAEAALRQPGLRCQAAAPTTLSDSR